MKENNIKESLQAKFNDFEVSPPANGWERLEMTLDRNRKVVMLRRRYIAAAAAVALLLVGSLLLIQTPQDMTNYMVQTSQDYLDESINKDDIEQDDLEKGMEIERNTQYVPQKIFTGITKKTNKQRKIQQSTYIQSENIADNRLADTEEEAHTTNAYEEYSNKNETPQEQMTRAEAEKRMCEFVEMAESKLVFEESTEKTDRPLLLALNARGGITPFQTTVNTPMTLRKVQGNPLNSETCYSQNDMLASGIQPIKNIAEMEHTLPLSFGMTLSKTIIDRLSVETGLVYTYLFSKAKNSNNIYNNEETQQFHYLGIPLQLNYNVFNINKLNVYASLGGMVEKDIRGELRLVESNNESVVANSYVTTKIKQKNPQYSMIMGLGVSYPIIDRFNLYGKIGGSYYFNANNDYKTIYSDKKIVLDLSLGVRYDIDIN